MNETEAKVKRCITKATGIPEEDLEAESGMGTHPDWDSLSHLSVLSALDEEFGPVTEDIRELGTAQSVREISMLIESYLNG